MWRQGIGNEGQMKGDQSKEVTNGRKTSIAILAFVPEGPDVAWDMTFKRD